MIAIEIESDLDKLSAKFDQMAQKQIPFATSLALNSLAQLAKANLKAVMENVFDRPRSYTLNSVYTLGASKSKLVATVGIKDQASSGTSAAQYLQSDIVGGVRAATPFEKLLDQYANSSGVTVPTKNIRLDSYGNIPKSVRLNIIRATQGKSTTNRGDIFIIPVGAKSHLKPGVYERLPNRVKIKRKGKTVTATGGGTRLKTLMLFKDQATYKPIFDLFGTVNQTVANNYAAEFAAAMDKALSTAKLTV